MFVRFIRSPIDAYRAEASNDSTGYGDRNGDDERQYEPLLLRNGQRYEPEHTSLTLVFNATDRRSSR